MDEGLRGVSSRRDQQIPDARAYVLLNWYQVQFPTWLNFSLPTWWYFSLPTCSYFSLPTCWYFSLDTRYTGDSGEKKKAASPRIGTTETDQNAVIFFFLNFSRFILIFSIKSFFIIVTYC